MKYRAEIDGLRALAVVPVILFHAGFELFSGGFVGVDVFFVISGYLITTILIEDIENKRFSIINFYERRARRILPVLFFVMLVCIPFAWMWMLPNQMKDFSQSFVAVSLFASNIFFWRESGGYFAAAAEEKPLLHTWSLAVEEQYYVLFPIFLFLAWRFGKNRVFWMIVVMATISLLFSEWGWRNKAIANFYLAPTRAWELFAGSLAAFIVQKQGVKKSNSLALLGLAAIVFSIFYYDESTPFPSFYALMPVIGAAFIILFAQQDTFVNIFLKVKPMVVIGLISYSAYLWHFPVFAFQKVLWLEHDFFRSLLSISFIFFLSYLSWRFIEKPFRIMNLSKVFVFINSIVIAALFITLGVFGTTSEGFKGRFEHEFTQNIYFDMKLSNTNCKDKYPELFSSFECSLTDKENLPSIAVVGDSHSLILYESLKEKMPYKNIIRLKYASCFPFVNDELLHRTENCIEAQKRLKYFLSINPQIEVVILSGYWGYLMSGGFSDEGINWRIHDKINNDDVRTFVINAKEFFEETNIPQRQFYLIQDYPDLDFSPERCNKTLLPVLRIRSKRCSMSYEKYSQRQQIVEPVMMKILGSYQNIHYVNVTKIFCNIEKCHIVANGKDLYSDGDHLNMSGGNLVVSELMKIMKLN